MWSGSFDSHPNSASRISRVDWLFTDRFGGVSQGAFESLNLAAHVGDEEHAVAANRVRLAEAIGVGSTVSAVIKAEHGSKVHEVTPATVDSVPVGDGLVTRSTDIALLALAADCAPIVLADSTNRVAGVVHCGWRGVVAGVVPATIDKMQELGAAEPSISVMVGPTICSECYVVGEDCAQQLAAAVPGSTQRDEEGQWHADVAGAVTAQLSWRGIRAQRIQECTFTNQRLFSYRRDHTTGRQGAAVVMRSLGGTP